MSTAEKEMGGDGDEDGGQDDWRARALHYSFGIFIAAGSVRPSVRPSGGDIACLNSESESADVRGVACVPSSSIQFTFHFFCSRIAGGARPQLATSDAGRHGGLPGASSNGVSITTEMSLLFWGVRNQMLDHPSGPSGVDLTPTGSDEIFVV